MVIPVPTGSLYHTGSVKGLSLATHPESSLSAHFSTPAPGAEHTLNHGLCLGIAHLAAAVGSEWGRVFRVETIGQVFVWSLVSGLWSLVSGV